MPSTGVVSVGDKTYARMMDLSCNLKLSFTIDVHKSISGLKQHLCRH